MSEVKVNKITPTADCGTVTLGDSGDTVAIASGATLTSAGSITNSGTITNTGTISGGTITGTIDGQVNWQTTVKTSGFTATAGQGFFCDTTSSAFTVTLPASPSAGDIVGVKDYANTADTNNITIGRNGSKIQGVENNFVISTEGLSIVLIYVDSTKGWLSVGQAKASDIAQQPLFVTATGGCTSTCGDFKVHKFTGPGTFCVSCAGNPLGSDKVDYLVVAGGGSGGGHYAGGGGGGHRFAFHLGAPSPSPFNAPACEPARSITATGFPITIGAGGSVGPAPGSDGSNSIFSTITSTGGGGASARPGGSGSGASGEPPNSGSNSVGAGNTPPVSPSQGHPGGPNGPFRKGGGGGGAGAAGAVGTGGNGVALPVPWFAGAGGGDNFPEGRYFSGGGGGGTEASPGSPFAGGKGGGGDGGNQSNGDAGGTNSGGGGGSGSRGTSSSGTRSAAAGGSGVVYIKYKFQ